MNSRQARGVGKARAELDSVRLRRVRESYDVAGTWPDLDGLYEELSR